ncbi:hypothetical protein ACWDUG_34380, partial [Streptomyces cellulosae]
KVKRIRARGDVLVGPCDLRGNPTSAAQVRGTDGLSMAPAAGWPGAQSWPDAAGMGQAAG